MFAHVLKLIFLTCCIYMVIGKKETLDKHILDKIRAGFLNFGDTCDFEKEKNFFKKLRETKRIEMDNLVETPEFKDKTLICDRFKYFVCEPSSKHCVCRKDTFMLENKTKTTHKFACEIKQNVTFSCHETLAPHWIADPVETLRIILPPDPNVSISSGIENYVCDEYTWSFTCRPRKECKTQDEKFKKDLNDIRNQARNTTWIPENGTCEEAAQMIYRKDRKIPFSMNMVYLNEIVRNSSISGTLCTILDGFQCVDEICACPEDTQKQNVTNNCKIIEGGVCSKYFWHDGNWIEYDFIGCAPNLECILPHDGINRICCQPNNTITGVGRCRCNDMIPFLTEVITNGTICGSDPTKYVNPLIVVSFVSLNFAFISALIY